jgi:hypothetical protein
MSHNSFKNLGTLFPGGIRDVTKLLRNQRKTCQKGGKYLTLAGKISFFVTSDQVQSISFIQKVIKLEEFLQKEEKPHPWVCTSKHCDLSLHQVSLKSPIEFRISILY